MSNMETILCNRKSTKNKWISTIIGKHYGNLHCKKRYGSKRSYGSSLYDCPCCCSLTDWKKEKKKRIRYDLHIQQLEGYADKDLFINSSENTMQMYADAYDSNYEIDPNANYIGEWHCSRCTYINFETSFCSMCMKAFDYNHQNNQNTFHYNDKHPLLIQYKPNKSDTTKRKNIKTKKHSDANIRSKQITNPETQTNSTKNMENYVSDAVQYRLNKSNTNNKNRKIKINKTKNVPVLIKDWYECLELVDIEISVVATKYNQYDYTKDKLFYNAIEDVFWIDVPMQLINVNLKQCFIKITPKNPQLQNAKLVYFEPLIPNFFIPIFKTEYSFIFNHDPVPEILQNRKLFRIIEHCLGQCGIKNIIFNRNISTNTFSLYHILFEYLPAMDILANILFPLVGYSQAIDIKTNVKNAQISIGKFMSQQNNEWNPIHDRYKSSLDYIIYKNQQRKPIVKNQSADNQPSDSDNQSEDSVHVQKRLLDTATKNIELENTTNISFKAPYKFSRYSNLLDDDPDRDKNWWQNVKYSKNIRRHGCKLGDKVRARKWQYNYVHWEKATVVQVTKRGVTVKFEYGSEELVSNRQCSKAIRLISTCNTDKIVNDKIIERKRKAYSKANRNYFMINGR
eukprot:452407_1